MLSQVQQCFVVESPVAADAAAADADRDDDAAASTPKQQ